MEHVVDSVLVIPRSKSFVAYYLNGSQESHITRYLDLQEYLIDLVPQEARLIIENIRSYQRFLVLVDTREIIRLRADDSVDNQIANHRAIAFDAKKLARKRKVKKSLKAVTGVIHKLASWGDKGVTS